MTEQIAKLLVVSMNTDMEPRRVELDLTPEECMVPAKMRGASSHSLSLPLTPFHSPQKQSSLSAPDPRVSSPHCAACSWA